MDVLVDTFTGGPRSSRRAMSSRHIDLLNSLWDREGGLRVRCRDFKTSDLTTRDVSACRYRGVLRMRPKSPFVMSSTPVGTCEDARGDPSGGGTRTFRLWEKLPIRLLLSLFNLSFPPFLSFTGPSTVCSSDLSLFKTAKLYFPATSNFVSVRLPKEQTDTQK